MPSSLTAFNADGLIVDCLALITIGGNRWYEKRAGQADQGALSSGELGLGPDNAVLMAVRWVNNLVVMNETDPDLALNTHFGPSNGPSAWTCFVQVDGAVGQPDRVVSSNSLNDTGGNFAQFHVTDSDDQAALNGVAASDQIIFAIAQAGTLTFDVTAPTFSIPENTAALVAIGTPVTASSTGQGTVTYALEGADAGSFTIDASGQIHVAAGVTFDFETRTSYSVTVKATLGSLSETLAVAINITNVDEAPVFNVAPPTISIPEDTAIGTDIGTPVTAADPEGGAVTYSLEGADAVSFAISSTGQLSTTAALDYETKSAYSFMVRATSGTLSATLAVTVNVMDVDEMPSGVNPYTFAPRTWTLGDAGRRNRLQQLAEDYQYLRFVLAAFIPDLDSPPDSLADLVGAFSFDSGWKVALDDSTTWTFKPLADSGGDVILVRKADVAFADLTEATADHELYLA